MEGWNGWWGGAAGQKSSSSLDVHSERFQPSNYNMPCRLEGDEPGCIAANPEAGGSQAGRASTVDKRAASRTMNP